MHVPERPTKVAHTFLREKKHTHFDFGLTTLTQFAIGFNGRFTVSQHLNTFVSKQFILFCLPPTKKLLDAQEQFVERQRTTIERTEKKKRYRGRQSLKGARCYPAVCAGQITELIGERGKSGTGERKGEK